MVSEAVVEVGLARNDGRFRGLAGSLDTSVSTLARLRHRRRVRANGLSRTRGPTHDVQALPTYFENQVT